MKDLEVAGIGRLAPERVVSERRATEQLRDQTVFDQIEAETAELLRKLRSPQAGGLDLRAQLGELVGFGRREPAFHDDRLGGNHDIGDQLLDPLEDRADGFGRSEIHGVCPQRVVSMSAGRCDVTLNVTSET